MTVLVLLLNLCVSTFAYTPKEGNVTATFGPFIYQTRLTSNPYVTSPYMGGVGLIAQGDISDHGALEIAMFHMNKNFYREEGNSFLAEQSEMIHITMGYRRWLSPWFAASWAIFSAYAMSDVNVIHSSVQSGESLDTSARDNAEYGLDLSLQFEVWNQGKFSTIVDTRYSHSFTGKKNEQPHHYGMMIGLKYFIQEKQVIQKPN